jgi:hypothetical protein
MIGTRIAHLMPGECLDEVTWADNTLAIQPETTQRLTGDAPNSKNIPSSLRAAIVLGHGRFAEDGAEAS